MSLAQSVGGDASGLVRTLAGASGTGTPAAAASPDASKAERIDAAARSFERLMVQRLLADMRRAGRTEEASNAMANWESMFDERIADLVAERGGFGVAESLRRSLGGDGADRPAPGGTRDAAAPLPLDRDALRALLPAPADAPGEPAPAVPSAARAVPAAPSRPVGAIGLGRFAADPPFAPAPAPGPDPAPGAGVPASERAAFLDSLTEHAERAARRLGTAAEAVLAVAALETGWGSRRIVGADGRDSHNLFGIKAHGAAADSPDAVSHRTTEFVGGAPRRLEDLFRRFDGPGDGVDGFADFVLDNPRYRPALDVAADPERFLRALHGAGYATDPRYADKAIGVLGAVRAHLGGDAPTTDDGAPSP